MVIPHNKLSMDNRGQDKVNGLQVFILHLKDLVSTVAPPYISRQSTQCHPHEVFLPRNRILPRPRLPNQT